MRANVIGGFLETHGYDYNFIERTDSRNFFRIQFVSELADLRAHLAGESAHLVRELEFVTGTFTKRFDTEILSPQGIYRFLRTRDRLRYGWRPRGIHHDSAEDIRADHDITPEDSSLPPLPDGTFRSDYSIEYVAGLVDGAARFRPQVAESSEHAIGHQLYPIVRLYRGGVNSALIDCIRQFCRDYNLRVGDSSEDNTLNMVFSGPGPIRRVLEVLYPQLFVAAEPAAVLDDAVLPRFDADDHLTKQGFYETLIALEEIAEQSGGASRDRDYTAEYFADLWSGELDTGTTPSPARNTRAQTEESDPEPVGSEPCEDHGPITLDPAAYTDAIGRYRTVVDRLHRDQEVVTELKSMYSDRCQMCGDRRARPDGTGFSEVHHIRPLGDPHDGPDVRENMLVLCPNHHADFDTGVVAVDPDSLTIDHPYDQSVDGRSLTVDGSHEISTAHLSYHEREILSRSGTT